MIKNESVFQSSQISFAQTIVYAFIRSRKDVVWCSRVPILSLIMRRRREERRDARSTS